MSAAKALQRRCNDVFGCCKAAAKALQSRCKGAAKPLRAHPPDPPAQAHARRRAPARSKDRASFNEQGREMMNAPPKLKHEIIDEIQVVLNCVEARAMAAEAKWGIGRLQTLVPIEWAEKYRSQRRKWLKAVWEQDADETRKHGEAMVRAIDKLDAMASESGAECGEPDQWEMATPEGLVILIRDIRRTNQVKLNGRRAQIWSVEELANVIRAHPVLAAAKDAFPGSTVESMRPPIDLKQKLDDDLMDLPF